jgi:long-chain-fatty-acid--CoA ligase ACSBG
VAPVLIENEIHTASPIFSQVVAIGDKKKYLSCLLVIKSKSPGVLADEVVNFVKPYGSIVTTVKEAMKCGNFRKAIQAGIDQANTKAISNAQKIQRWVVLENEFSVDGGELTPTLKLKRKIINQKYEAAIESMYETPKL